VIIRACGLAVLLGFATAAAPARADEAPLVQCNRMWGLQIALPYYPAFRTRCTVLGRYDERRGAEYHFDVQSHWHPYAAGTMSRDEQLDAAKEAAFAHFDASLQQAGFVRTIEPGPLSRFEPRTAEYERRRSGRAQRATLVVGLDSTLTIVERDDAGGDEPIALLPQVADAASFHDPDEVIRLFQLGDGERVDVGFGSRGNGRAGWAPPDPRQWVTPWPLPTEFRSIAIGRSVTLRYPQRRTELADRYRRALPAAGWTLRAPAHEHEMVATALRDGREIEAALWFGDGPGTALRITVLDPWFAFRYYLVAGQQTYTFTPTFEPDGEPTADTALQIELLHTLLLEHSDGFTDSTGVGIALFPALARRDADARVRERAVDAVRWTAAQLRARGLEAGQLRTPEVEFVPTSADARFEAGVHLTWFVCRPDAAGTPHCRCPRLANGGPSPLQQDSCR